MLFVVLLKDINDLKLYPNPIAFKAAFIGSEYTTRLNLDIKLVGTLPRRAMSTAGIRIFFLH